MENLIKLSQSRNSTVTQKNYIFGGAIGTLTEADDPPKITKTTRKKADFKR